MLPYIETHIVDHCNLNCRGCSHFSCLSEKSFKDLDEFIHEMSDLSVKENVQIIRLMGGEPLLHPQWLQFCVATRELFPSSDIYLVTNGLLSQSILEPNRSHLERMNIQVCQSDYGLDMKHKERLLHDKQTMYNVSLDLAGNQQPMTAFYNCDLAMNKWYYFANGRLFNCCVFGNIEIFKKHFGVDIDYDIDDVSISVADHTAEEIEEFLSKPHEACRFCNTVARAKSRIPFARTKKEISEWTISNQS